VAGPLESLLLPAYELTGDERHFAATVDMREAMRCDNWRLRSPRAEAMAIASALKRLGAKPARREVRGRRERGFAGLRRRVGR
jgi:hypothetical protein